MIYKIGYETMNKALSNNTIYTKEQKRLALQL